MVLEVMSERAVGCRWPHLMKMVRGCTYRTVAGQLQYIYRVAAGKDGQILAVQESALAIIDDVDTTGMPC